MVIKLSKALLIIYTTMRLGSLARTKLPTALQVSMEGPSITTECELTMRLRLLHIAVRKTPPLFLIFPPRHRDLRLPPSHRAQSVSPGLTTSAKHRAELQSQHEVLCPHIHEKKQQ